MARARLTSGPRRAKSSARPARARAARGGAVSASASGAKAPPSGRTRAALAVAVAASGGGQSYGGARPGVPGLPSLRRKPNRNAESDYLLLTGQMSGRRARARSAASPLHTRRVLPATSGGQALARPTSGRRTPSRPRTPSSGGTSGGGRLAHAFRSKAEWRWAFATHKAWAHKAAHASRPFKSLPARKGGPTLRTAR